MNKKKVLIIGFGSIGKKHAEIINSYWPEYIISIVSSSSNNSYKKINYIKNNFDNINKALIWSPDFVIICSPSNKHLDQALIFARRNIPTFIEKPVGDGTESESIRSELLFLSKKVPIMVGYVFRYDECFKNVQKFLYSNQFDSLIEVDCYCGSWLPDWRTNQDYFKSVSSNKKLGGGVILELSHEIDFINYLLGPIKINYASKSNSQLLNIDVEDNAFIYASSNKCKSIKISLNFCTSPKERYIKFQFAKGILIWDLIEQVVLIENYAGKKTIFYKSPFNHEYKYKMELENFFKFSSNQEETLSDFDNALKVLDLINIAKNFKI